MTTRPIFLIGFISLLLPFSTHALMMKVPKVTRADTYKMKLEASTAKKKSSSSSASTSEIVRSYDGSFSFKMPSDWKKVYEEKDFLAFSHELDKVEPINRSTIKVGLIKNVKEKTPDILYKRILKNITMDDLSPDSIAIDYYVPSVQVLSHEVIKVAGRDALSVSYSGDRLGDTAVIRSVYVFDGDSVYFIKAFALVENATADQPAFDTVVKTFALSPSRVSSSSSSSERTRVRTPLKVKK